MGVSAVVGAVGLAASALGVGTSIYGAEQQSEAQQQMLAIQAQQQKQRQDLFELEQQRKRVEDLRQGQIAQSTARSNAVSQGAQFGSGLLGGLAEVQGESNYNILGINQNTLVGENLFGLDQQLTEAKIASAQASTYQQIGSSLTSFGGQAISSMDSVGRLTSGFGSSAPIASSTSFSTS